MTRHRRFAFTLVLSAAAAACVPAATAEGASPADILDAAKLKGGLIAVLGCEDPALLTGLRASDAYVVHGLDRDAAKVAAARKHIGEAGAYGPVTAGLLRGGKLPFVDDVVNAVVVTAGAGEGLADGEIARVLAPRGVCVDLRGGKAKTDARPVPDAIDDWPQYLYDASNNAVSTDRAIAPPSGLRWTVGPPYARSHEHFGSVSAMVSAAGRVFYIIDEGPISSVFLPPKWVLVARDAFSGVQLWKRPILNWESPLRGFRSGPPENGRRMVADGENLYVTLGYGRAVSVIDPATGKELRKLPGTERAREMVLEDGTLYVITDDMTAADHDKRKAWINRTAPKLNGYRFPAEKLDQYGRQRLAAVNASSGDVLWSLGPFAAAGEVLPATLAVDDGRVCFQTTSHVVCLNASSGERLWRAERPVATSRFSWSTPTLVVHDGVVLTGDRVAKDNARKPPAAGTDWIMDNSHQSKKQAAELIAHSLSDGKQMWRAACFENYDTQMDIFVIDGVVWVGDLRGRGAPGYTEGRDLKTGKVVRELPDNKKLYNLRMGHHRCYRNRATVRYLILGRDGLEFVDPKAKTGDGNWWIRGTCQYGIMPANGMVYVPQHSCACHPDEKLNGFNVLAADPAGPPEKAKPAPALEKGPAYGTDAGKADADGDWPTYRRDAARRGYQDLPAPRGTKQAWRAELSAPITPPVIAGGRVLVAETDLHTVRCLSAENGKAMWAFVADGRVDSPPTVHGKLCVFGTRGGSVYCLRADDGELVWRFRAAPAERKILAYEQLESPWPVHGAVLVDASLSGGKPVAYFAAGRSSHTDGGIVLTAVDLATGAVRARQVICTGDSPPKGAMKTIALPDILSVQHGLVWMRNVGLGPKLGGAGRKVRHLYAPGGFLDDTWWHRTYWMYGTAMRSGYGGWPQVGNITPAGRLLALDGGEFIYGYGRMKYRAGAGHVRPDAAKDYKLFAEVLSPPPLKPEDRKKARRGRRRPRGRRVVAWAKPLPFIAKAVVLTRDGLVCGGGASLTETAAEHGRGTLWIASREDGSRTAAATLPASPVLDGLAVTDSGIYVCTLAGEVVCLRGM